MSASLMLLALWAAAVLLILLLLLVVWRRQRSRGTAADSQPVDAGDLLVRALVLVAIVTMATFFAYILMGFAV